MQMGYSRCHWHTDRMSVYLSGLFFFEYNFYNLRQILLILCQGCAMPSYKPSLQHCSGHEPIIQHGFIKIKTRPSMFLEHHATSMRRQVPCSIDRGLCATRDNTPRSMFEAFHKHSTKAHFSIRHRSRQRKSQKELQVWIVSSMNNLSGALCTRIITGREATASPIPASARKPNRQPGHGVVGFLSPAARHLPASHANAQPWGNTTHQLSHSRTPFARS
ncbi:hypothetical protein B0T14DRAFT_124784 [Immersiella caudata]|uniref:Uncharacterized protein n=1 Tax=Immersiella caudata TaxID=314043 RepID=A0AA39X498_9PEZI|nr:hypothetical protein B0T14DRAFT_124784 [Immersiella caudata]